jgi:hypothetical protein
MKNFVKEVYEFNKQAGFIEGGYNATKEVAYILEEALECAPDIKLLGNRIHPSTEDLETPREISLAISNLIHQNKRKASDVEVLDQNIDIIIFALGAIFKLGLSPQEVNKAISLVCQANNKKLSAGTDELGKQLKPDNWGEIVKQLDADLEQIVQNAASKQ